MSEFIKLPGLDPNHRNAVRRTNERLKSQLMSRSDSLPMDEVALVAKILGSGIYVGTMLDQGEYDQYKKTCLALAGARIGIASCYDPRMVTVHTAGLSAKSSKEGAALIATEQRREDPGNPFPDRFFYLNHSRDGRSILVPKAPFIRDAIATTAAQLEDEDCLQLLTPHSNCGGMAQRYANRVANLSSHPYRYPELENVHLIDHGNTKKAMHNLVNESRRALGRPMYSTVCKVSVWDVATAGPVLSLHPKGYDKSLFLAEVTNTVAPEIESILGSEVGHFSSMKRKFLRSAFLPEYLERRLKIADVLMNDSRFSDYRQLIDDMTGEGLTSVQKQAMLFYQAYSSGLQYLSGSSQYPVDRLSRFQVDYGAVSTNGKTLNQYHPGLNGFSSTPPDHGGVVEHTKQMCEIIDRKEKHRKQSSGVRSIRGSKLPDVDPFRVFVCTPVSRLDYEARSSEFSAAVARSIQAQVQMENDAEIRRRRDSGALKDYYILIDDKTGAALELSPLIPRHDSGNRSVSNDQSLALAA